MPSETPRPLEPTETDALGSQARGKSSPGNAPAIARRVAELIETGHFKPGDAIREADLQALFGVSRSPIREALRILESRWLVRLEPRRGARVITFDDQEFMDVVRLRGVTFALSAGWAAERAEGAARQAILAEAEALVAAARKGLDPRAFVAETLLLARRIVLAARSSPAASVIAGFSLGGPALVAPLSHLTRARQRQSAAIFLGIAQAINNSDPQTARDLSEQLTEEAIAVTLQVLDEAKEGLDLKGVLYPVSLSWDLDRTDEETLKKSVTQGRQ